MKEKMKPKRKLWATTSRFKSCLLVRKNYEL